MLPGCFYVLLVLGFAMNLNFSNVNLLPEPLDIKIGWTTLTLRNFQLNSLDLPPTSFNFTSDIIALDLDGTGHFSATVDVKVPIFGWQTAPLDATLSGSIDINKDSPDTCASDSVTVGKCDLKATFKLLAWDVDLPLCDVIAPILTSALNPAEPPLEALPALAKGDTSIKKGSYFNSIITKVALGNLLGAKGWAKWASDTALHFSYDILFPISANVDTRRWSATTGARLLGRLILSLWGSIKSTYNLPNIDHYVSGAITNAAGGNVSISFSSADGFFADLVNNNASLYFSTYIPRSAGLDFDLVAQGHQCSLFGLVCSLPATNGLELMNTRFTGLGDADAIFSNLLSNTTEVLLNRIVTDVLTVKSLKVGQRRILSPI